MLAGFAAGVDLQEDRQHSLPLRRFLFEGIQELAAIHGVNAMHKRQGPLDLVPLQVTDQVPSQRGRQGRGFSP